VSVDSGIWDQFEITLASAGRSGGTDRDQTKAGERMSRNDVKYRVAGLIKEF